MFRWFLNVLHAGGPVPATDTCAERVFIEAWRRMDSRPQLDARLRAALPSGAEPSVPREELRKEDAVVYETLSYDARSIDAIIETTGLSPAQVSASLLSLELSGHVRQLPGQQYMTM